MFKKIIVLTLLSALSCFADISVVNLKPVTLVYKPGQIQDLQLKLDFPIDDNITGEWLDGIQLDFPLGLEIISATEIRDKYNQTLYHDNTVGDGAVIIWGDVASHSGSGTLGGYAEFSVQIKAASSLPDSLNISWLINGDGADSDPHIKTGTITLFKQTDQAMLFANSLQLQYDYTPVGGCKNIRCEIFNAGRSSIELQSSDFVFTSSQFRLGLTEFPFRLLPGETKELTISFIPEASGDIAGILKADNSTASHKLKISLQGKGYLPYTELDYSFEEEYSKFTAGWQSIDYDGDGKSFCIMPDEEISGTVFHGSRVAGNQYNLSSPQVRNNDWLISPRLSITADNRRLSFWCKAMEFNGLDFSETVILRIHTADDNGYAPDSNFFKILEKFNQTGRVWAKREIDLGDYIGKQVEIAWQVVSVNQNSFLIDSIALGKNLNGIEENTSVQPELLSCYPNPFNPSTILSFYQQSSGMANLTVYNARGQKVAVPVNQHLPSGVHKVAFNAVNLPGGIYFARLQSNGQQEVRKIMLVK